MSLADQLKRSRKIKVTVGKFTFFARRPTDAEASALFKSGDYNNTLYVAREFVTGWDDVIETDILEGQSTDPAKFTRELWLEWVDDRPDFWEPIHTQVMDSYTSHAKKREDVAKN